MPSRRDLLSGMATAEAARSFRTARETGELVLPKTMCILLARKQFVVRGCE
jgi:hypothetical protein